MGQATQYSLNGNALYIHANQLCDGCYTFKDVGGYILNLIVSSAIMITVGMRTKRYGIN